MIGDYLVPEARSALDLPVEERLAVIDKDIYIPHPKAEHILDSIDRLLSRPTNGRLGMLISGPSGSGKSTLFKVFTKKHPRVRLTDYDNIPVLRVETPEVPGGRRFLGAMLEAFGLDDYDKTGFETRKIRVKKELEGCKVKLVLVDEIHNLLAGSAKLKEETCNLLKNLTNTFNLPMVLAGTERAEHVFRYDAQLVSRFPVFRLPVWTDGKAYRLFLKMLESTIPLRQPSGLSSAELAPYILKQSNGVLADIVLAVKSAARLAVLDGSEKVTIDLLKRSSFGSRQLVLSTVSVAQV